MNSDSGSANGLPGLAALAREVTPAETLEDRTVRVLAQHGLLRSPAARRTRVWQAAAAIVVFASGLALGRVSASPPANPPTAAPRFLLLLEGGSQSPTPADEAETVNAYRAWAVRLRSEGRFVAGERLGAASVVVPAPAAGGGEDDIRGFFLISADSLDDATAVARSCPHATRGGRVNVRPIDPT